MERITAKSILVTPFYLRGRFDIARFKAELLGYEQEVSKRLGEYLKYRPWGKYLGGRLESIKPANPRVHLAFTCLNINPNSTDLSLHPLFRIPASKQTLNSNIISRKSLTMSGCACPHSHAEAAPTSKPVDATVEVMISMLAANVHES